MTLLKGGIMYRKYLQLASLNSAVEKDLMLLSIIASVPIYLYLIYILNKKFNLDLPYLPERFYDDPVKTWIQPILLFISIILVATPIFILESLLN